MRALILEDNKERIKILIRSLCKYVIDITSSSIDCIKKIKKNKYDIILLDHDLGPEEKFGNGYEVAKVIPGSINNETRIIITSWNTPASDKMLDVIGKTAIRIPFRKEWFLPEE